MIIVSYIILASTAMCRPPSRGG